MTTVERYNSLRRPINNSVIWGTTISTWPRIWPQCSPAIVSRTCPVEDGPRGYIVIIDTHDKSGSHWIALVDEREGLYGHGQFCRSVTQVRTARPIRLVDGSFRGARE